MQLLAVGSKFTLITQGKVGVGLALTLASKENLTEGSNAVWGVEESKGQEMNVEKTSQH